MTNYGDRFMKCPDCGGQAESDAVDVGVGLYIAGNFACACGWEINADGMANVATYDDWFPDSPIVAQQQCGADYRDEQDPAGRIAAALANRPPIAPQ